MDTITAKAQEIANLALPLLEAIKTAEISAPPMVVGVYFNCPDGQRKEFIQEWAQEAEAWAAGFDEEKVNFALLVISLEPCGGQATYRTADDVPLVDVPCPCGDPNHWLIKWERLPYTTTKSNMTVQELGKENLWTF